MARNILSTSSCSVSLRADSLYFFAVSRDKADEETQLHEVDMNTAVSKVFRTIRFTIDHYLEMYKKLKEPQVIKERAFSG